jgi:hypothetical protein
MSAGGTTRKTAVFKDEEGKMHIKWFWPPGKGKKEETWSIDHARLLYVVRHYAKCATKPGETEGWIRDLPLNVLMYELIKKQILDFDYAPCSVSICPDGTTRRLWMNITQEGKAALDDMREGALVNSLRMSTEDFQPVTAYQCSEKGLALLEKLPDDDKAAVDRALFPAGAAFEDSARLAVSFIPGRNQFRVSTASGQPEAFVSNVTETEDVSYVSSPYLPARLRADPNKKMSTNAHRAGEAAMGASEIADELSEAIVLANVHVLVSEWIPFGSNQIVSLNERLGALDRCPGGFFTNQVDEAPSDTKFAVDPGLTRVRILDFDYVRFANFEAEINFPEESEDIVQVESFGMHLSADGTVVYGLYVDAIGSRLADDVSIDQLSRVLVDVHQDSSRIMNDLMSPYQRTLMDLIFEGDLENRNKYNMVIAVGVRPKLAAAKYMDRGEFENELKQVLGAIHASHDLGMDDVLLLGKAGAMLAGPHARENEPLLLAYLSLLGRELFIRNFFTRTFCIDGGIDDVQTIIERHAEDPGAVAWIRERTSALSRANILLQSVLEYLRESLSEMKLPDVTDGATESERALDGALELSKMRKDLQSRVADLKKLGASAAAKLTIVGIMSNTVTKKELAGVVKKIDVNYAQLVSASNAEARAAVSVQVMELIFSGGFALDLIDRIDGDDTLGGEGVDNPNGGAAWVNEYIRDTVIVVPGLWFALNMAFLALFMLCLRKFLAHLISLSSGACSVRATINKRCDLGRLRAYLTSKTLDNAAVLAQDGLSAKTATWEEPKASGGRPRGDAGTGPGGIWALTGGGGGSGPKITLEFDEVGGFLLAVLIQWNKNGTMLTDRQMLNTFHAEMLRAGVYTDTERLVPNVYVKIEPGSQLGR